ncbi:MAG: type II secretion system protein [Candidatus Liptonbacteria bacterium]|nr:type II secretion system protein [Candidatus Liptonbacteria bacterium]
MRLPSTAYRLLPTVPDASRRGFTLIEILVVVSISILLAAYGLSYSSVSHNQTTLFIQRAQAGQFVLKAKSLTLSTKLRESVAGRPCGYGVRVSYGNPSSLILFHYSLTPEAGALPPEGVEVCKKADGTLRPFSDFVGGENGVSTEEEIVFDSEVRLRADAGKLDRVFFLAPDPQTFIWADGSGTPSASLGTLTLETVDGKATTTVKVMFTGGVNF